MPRSPRSPNAQESIMGASRLCLCLTAPTCEGVLKQIERYGAFIDMAELRADLLEPGERRKIGELPSLVGMNIPLILTARLREDGGRWGLSGERIEDRETFFLQQLESGGWAYADLEYNRPMPHVVSAAASAGCRIIRSHHDFSGNLLSASPEELASMIRNMAAEGGIPKLAVSCKSGRDVLTLAQAAKAAGDVSEKVLLGMGEYGAPTRILAQRLGSAWTYASSAGLPDDPPAAAPGQIDPETLRNLYGFHEIEAQTPLYGIAGNPVSHSLSPQIHNGWLRKAGLPGTYLPFLTDDLKVLLELCDLWGVTGLSVTVPHKKEALALADRAESLAKTIGAANTLVHSTGGWTAWNTDVDGFLAPLFSALNGEEGKEGEGEKLEGLRALVIGAGGAARAAVHALSNAGADVLVLNRTVSKAQILAEEVGGTAGPLSAESLPLLNGTDIVVQTTTVGMHPNESGDPVPWWNLSGCSLVYDMIYAPEETVFLRRARNAGIPTLNGSGMLEAQARAQFGLFTGTKAP